MKVIALFVVLALVCQDVVSSKTYNMKWKTVTLEFNDSIQSDPIKIIFSVDDKRVLTSIVISYPGVLPFEVPSRYFKNVELVNINSVVFKPGIEIHNPKAWAIEFEYDVGHTLLIGVLNGEVNTTIRRTKLENGEYKVNVEKHEQT